MRVVGDNARKLVSIVVIFLMSVCSLFMFAPPVSTRFVETSHTERQPPLNAGKGVNVMQSGSQSQRCMPLDVHIC